MVPRSLEKEKTFVTFDGEERKNRPAGEGHPFLAPRLSRLVCTPRTPSLGRLRAHGASISGLA